MEEWFLWSYSPARVVRCVINFNHCVKTWNFEGILVYIYLILKNVELSLSVSQRFEIPLLRIPYLDLHSFFFNWIIWFFVSFFLSSLCIWIFYSLSDVELIISHILFYRLPFRALNNVLCLQKILFSWNLICCES